ncbi:MAG: CBS domain-containing protein [Betaproteobacteria bacterium]|jgi:CBS domain-containing protein|nr:CBS domain-containing protein [Betaproteobacteria bacterium]
MKVSKILELKGTTLFTMSPQDSLANAVMVMAEHDIGSIVVMAQGRLAGMLTFREVIRILAKRQSENRIGPTPPISSFKIAEVMNPQPTIVHPDMDVDTLRKLMVDSHERYLPVMEGELLMGVISFHDVAKAVLDKQSFENKMLKAYIRDWPQEDKAE